MEPAVREEALESLRRGNPPPDLQALEAITVGEREGIWNFWRDHYLNDYIACGGSKVKFLTGKPGSGKTHALLLMLEEARRLGYVTFFTSARRVRLNKFDSIYQTVLDTVDAETLVTAYCDRVIGNLGYQPGQLEPGQDFFSWAQAQGRAADSLRREIQEKLDELYRDRKINHNFAMAFTQLCAHHLGSRRLADEQKEILQEWLKGRPLPARALKPLKIFTRVDKYNARHMMASFLHLLRLCGHRGLCVAVDDLSALLERGPEGRMLYGRSARNEVYESLRQLVDDFAGFEGAFFVFAGRSELIYDEKGGFKSYEALWMRIQNEVSGARPNKFADLFNQDLLVKEFFTAETCLELQQRLNETFGLGSCIRQEDFHYLVESVSMLSPVRRAVEAIVNYYDAGGERDGEFCSQTDH
ncbi:ATP-binding protein [Pelotomaculum isophthalicicum JI]|uniref:ATP-binding protein n=1 Tax=Pelotomaculum isophthalicicum JI TaxID=947010 RepID=A0A9X4H3Z0_9FIRM|nr:BREX system ATP-binding domain-containing protein [Pelotomaculum isophthalicicum]MDF9408343.1 ATP-binding protein [Pelotomaculum isophthalicicum JI]